MQCAVNNEISGYRISGVCYALISRYNNPGSAHSNNRPSNQCINLRQINLQNFSLLNTL